MTDETILALFARQEDILVTFIENFYDFKKEVTEQFAKINTRLDAIEARLDRVEVRLDRVEARLDRVEARLDRVEARLDSIEARLNSVEEELHEIRVEGAVDRAKTGTMQEALRKSSRVLSAI